MEGWIGYGFEGRLVVFRDESAIIILGAEFGLWSEGKAEDEEGPFSGPDGVTSVDGIGALYTEE